MGEVVDAITELCQRKILDSHDAEIDVCRCDSDNDSTGIFFDHCLESMYGNIDEKVGATADIVIMCKHPENLEIIIQHHAMMSALSRMLSEDCVKSMHLTFNLAKVFLAMSKFVDLHTFLTTYRVGSLIMSAMELEVKRSKHEDQIENKMMKKKEEENYNSKKSLNKKHRKDKVIYVCLSVLLRLSDDTIVLCKMMKKGLLQIICNSFNRTSKECILTILTILTRVCTFEETVIEISNYPKSVFSILIKMLSISDEEINCVVLEVLFNLSFNHKCRLLLNDADLIPNVSRLIKIPLMRERSLKLLCNISMDKYCQKHMTSQDLVSIIIHLIVKFPCKLISDELGVIAINVSYSKNTLHWFLSLMWRDKRYIVYQ